MSRARVLSHVELLLSLVFLLAAPALAQYGASLQGTVTDKSGAVVAGAAITATNKESGVSRNATTGDSGFYRITGLPPGDYIVTVEAPSFKKSSTDNVAVAGESLRGFDVSLVPTQAQESVTVSAALDPLSTEDATLSSALSSREIDALPKFGRDPYELIRFSPGVFGDGARQGNGNSQVLPQQVGPGGSNFSIFQTENAPQVVSNGQRVTANDYTLDGVSVNSLSHGGAAVVTPNAESVQELLTISGFSSAQDGRNSGAHIKVLSKSGTNNFHGSAFAKFDDKGLNAFNKYYGPTNVPLTEISCEGGTFQIVAKHCPSRVDRRYRDYAGSFGGPIIKNHLFFFFSYEGYRERGTTISRDIKLETPSFRDYVVNTNPNSIAAQIFQTPGIAPRIATTTSETDCCSLIPNYGLGKWYIAGNQLGQAIGNGPDGITDWGIYDLTLPFRIRGDQYNGRVDYTHGNNQFFASTYIVRLDQLGGGQRPLEDLTLKPSDYVGTIGWTRTFGSTMLNELRFNGTRFFFDQTAPVGQTNFGIPQIRIFDFDANGLGDPGRVLGISRSSTTPSKAAQNTYAFADTFSLVHRTHAFKFGVQITREQNNNDQPGGERPDYQFRGLLNFANDACCFFEGVSVDPLGGALNSQRYFRTADYGVFIQDDWKLRPNLTINLGLRWEYFNPDTEAKNTLSNYVLGAQGFIDGSVKTAGHLYNGDHNNFGPRIGFAWSPTKYDNKVVFRGGFGLLYNRYFGDVFQNVRQNTPFTAEVGTCCFFDPRDPIDPTQGVTGPPPGSNILYAIGASREANSYPVNPALSFGVAPDGALCADALCDAITKVDLFAALPNTPTPYVYSYNFQTQYEPIRHLVATLGYQGSRSRKLVRTIDVNRLIPGDTFDGLRDEQQTASADGTPCGPSNPACPANRLVGNNRFGRIFFPLPDVNASYDAAIFQLRHQFHGGVELAGAYTWSHTIDTVSYEIGFQQTDPSNQSLNRGSSDYDVRHNLVLSGLWELPFYRSRKDFVGQALGGWTISGVMSKHSGMPFTALIGACDQSNDRNGDSYCPDMPFRYTGGIIASPSKQDWINGVFPNPAASFPGVTFIPDPSVKGPGCRCRNIFSGPGYTSVDMSVGKDFAFSSHGFFGEAARLEIRANFFNLFNILNLQPLVPATSSTDILNGTDFGRSIDGQAGRVVEFQARFSF